LHRSAHRSACCRFSSSLRQSSAAILLVTSQAPLTAKKGQPYSYKLTVKSKKGSPRFRLESAPPGMTVSDDGQLSWAVPESFSDSEVAVIISVRDAAGQECFHTFTLAVRD